MDNVYVLLKAIRAHEGYVSIVLTLGYNGISLSKHSWGIVAKHHNGKKYNRGENA